MLVRAVRAILGTTLLLLGLPLLLAGGALWYALQHQDSAGGYAATVSRITTAGHAIVASDVDELLRREAPLARSDRTTLRLTAHTSTGPAFLGLAPEGDVAGYLADVPHQRVEEVRLARGPLPVVSTPVSGVGEPASPPSQQRFWLHSSDTGLLEWSPHELRDQQLAVVVMAPDASAPLTVDLTARVQPRWLDSTTYALLVLGAMLSLAGVLVLAWPAAGREVVYVVPPDQVPELAAELGIPLPRDAAGYAVPAPPTTVVPGSVVASAPVGSPELVAAPQPAQVEPARTATGHRFEWPPMTTEHVTATPMSVPPAW